MSHSEQTGGVGPAPSNEVPAVQASGPQRPHRGGRFFNRYNARTAAYVAGGALAVLGVSDIVSSCDDGGIVQQTATVGDLGAVMDWVGVPKAPIALIDGSGHGTVEIVSAPQITGSWGLFTIFKQAINAGSRAVDSRHATTSVPTTVELRLDSGAVSLKPYYINDVGTPTETLRAEAIVNVNKITSRLVENAPQMPNESSGEGIFAGTTDVFFGHAASTKIDNAANVVAQRFFQDVCGRSTLNYTAIGVQQYVQTIFKLDAEFFKGSPEVSSTLDQEMVRLSQEKPEVVFKYKGQTVPASQLSKYVTNFAPPLPTKKSVAKLIGTRPTDVVLPAFNNQCESTTSAINQQYKLIQEAAAAEVK